MKHFFRVLSIGWFLAACFFLGCYLHAQGDDAHFGVWKWYII